MGAARASTVVLAVLAVTGWGAAALAGGAALALATAREPAAAPSAAVPPEGPLLDERLAEGPLGDGPVTDRSGTYLLTVHDDGCGVVRTEGPGGADLDPLVWSVTDADGFEVLSRNALGETRYRYFAGGTYDVVLESWGGSSYVPVSNTVTITC